jgi:WD40 repeat protein
LWDALTGAPIGPGMPFGGTVGALEFAPAGDRLVTLSAEHSIQVWDTRTSSRVGAAMRSKADTLGLAFSADGTRLVIASGDDSDRAGVAEILDLRTGAPVGRPIQLDGEVTGLAFAPVGDLLATATMNNTVALWDSRTGLAVGAPLHDNAPPSMLSFAPDGSSLAIREEDTVTLWRLPGALVVSRSALARRVCADTLPNGLSHMSEDELAITVGLDPAIGADVCRPVGFWEWLWRMTPFGNRAAR